MSVTAPQLVGTTSATGALTHVGGSYQYRITVTVPTPVLFAPILNIGFPPHLPTLHLPGLSAPLQKMIADLQKLITVVQKLITMIPNLTVVLVVKVGNTTVINQKISIANIIPTTPTFV